MRGKDNKEESPYGEDKKSMLDCLELLSYLLLDSCQDVIESLEKLKIGKKTLCDLSHKEFNENFVFNSRLRELLVPVWNTFGSYFVDLDQAEFDLIKHHAVSQSEHFTMLLKQLRSNTKEITIDQFLKAFKKTIKL